MPRSGRKLSFASPKGTRSAQRFYLSSTCRRKIIPPLLSRLSHRVSYRNRVYRGAKRRKENERCVCHGGEDFDNVRPSLHGSLEALVSARESRAIGIDSDDRRESRAIEGRRSSRESTCRRKLREARKMRSERGKGRLPSLVDGRTHLFVAPIPRRQVRRTRTGRKDVHNIGALEAGRLTILFDPLSLQALARAFNITVSTTSSRVVKKSSPRHPFVFLRRETFLKIFLLNRKKKEKRTELFFLLYIYICSKYLR